MGFARAGRAVDALLLRDGRALALRRPGRSATRPTPTTDKPFVEVSGRKGLGVKADDLLDRLIETAAREVAARNPELSPADDATDGGGHRDRRRALLPGEVHARQDHRVRHRRSLELRGRDGPVPPVRRRARRTTSSPSSSERDGVSAADVVARLAALGRDPIETGRRRATNSGAWCSKPRAWTKSSTRRCVRSSSPSSPSSRSAWRSRSTRSTTASRSCARSAKTRGCGAPRPWSTSGRQLTTALDLMGCARAGADVANVTTRPVIAVAWPKDDYLSALGACGGHAAGRRSDRRRSSRTCSTSATACC